MAIRSLGLITGMAALTAVIWAGPTQALTMQACSSKYKAAQAAGSVGGKSWNEFRKAECGADASAAMNGGAVFPNKIATKYARQPAGQARRRTCLEQYNANKAGGGNGNLKWIEKSGGYYSECNKRLAQK